MYWQFTCNNTEMISWGQPRVLPSDSYSNCRPNFDIPIYSGQNTKPDDSFVMIMQGDSTLGMGDSIWILSFIQNIFTIKGRRKCRFTFYSSPDILRFYSNFLPSVVELKSGFPTKEEFDAYTYKLPCIYYWQNSDTSDKSWVDGRSILARMHAWVGLEYTGLPDFGALTKEDILYPPNEFYKKLNINRQAKYVFFQWHSSGHAKNLPPESNIKLIKHLIKNYGLEVYLIGFADNLNCLEQIKGVHNLSRRTLAEDVVSLAFNAELIVAPDSAGIHLGEAFRIPTVGILSTLPPIYIANNYKIPSFMFGSGLCVHKPCGIVSQLPLDRCPTTSNGFCNVLNEIDLQLFDKCVEKTNNNRNKMGSTEPEMFYNALTQPI